MRLSAENEAPAKVFGSGFDAIFAARKSEADEFFDQVAGAREGNADARNVIRQAYAGLLWTKQFYYYTIPEWLAGDPAQPKPPPERLQGRNHTWPHLYNRDVLSMPDKWEYPWFAAWDLAFHMIPMAKIDPDFAKHQLVLLLREWYMHPNGQIPAYEFAFGDVNPPVHAWAAWRVYKMTGPRGQRDRAFLESVFQKLLLNFTWWVNRKDMEGNNLFSGGFLGLDNIGVFDRSKPLPTGGYLQQADGTAWMAFYCLTMLSMALELAQTNRAYEDMASKFFEHFIHISDAMNSLGEGGLWDEADGFYYDELKTPRGRQIPLKTRSLVGLMPLIAVEILESTHLEKLPGFTKRMNWFLKHRADLAPLVTMGKLGAHGRHRMLSIMTRERLERVLAYVLDEAEFLSPYGVRSLSQIHRDHPYIFHARERRASSRLRAGRKHELRFRRELQLAWAGLVPDQLSHPRGAGALSPFLWRRRAGGMSEGFRRDAEPRAGGDGTRAAHGQPLSARRKWRASVCGGRCALRDRSALARSRALPRIFPWRQRPRTGREPSNRVDRARRTVDRGYAVHMAARPLRA